MQPVDSKNTEISFGRALLHLEYCFEKVKLTDENRRIDHPNYIPPHYRAFDNTRWMDDGYLQWVQTAVAYTNKRAFTDPADQANVALIAAAQVKPPSPWQVFRDTASYIGRGCTNDNPINCGNPLDKLFMAQRFLHHVGTASKNNTQQTIAT